MRPHPYRRSSDRLAERPQWRIEEAELVRRAHGDANLLAVMRAAQTAPPADDIAFREQAMLPLVHARMVIGGGKMQQRDRVTCLALIDQVVKIVEDSHG